MDTYRGCTYGCLFCFARDLLQFARRNQSEEKKIQTYLVGNNPSSFKRWIERTMKKEIDYNHAEEVAFKERMPLKIGACADPFPFVESTEHITYDVLKALDELDYPVQLSTKNPEVFLGYADEFKNSNIALNVSISFCDDDIARQIECGAIPPSRRFAAIRRLSDMGFKILVRVQPFILPYTFDNAERFVKTIKDSGAFGFQTEGLKLRVTMSKSEKEIYTKIEEVFNFDIINDFKENGEIEGGDRVYSKENKCKMLSRFTELANENGIKFINADNMVDGQYGCGCECCGTEFLRNHSIWGECSRAKASDISNCKCVSEFGKCIVNFTRSKSNFGKTIQQVTEEYVMKN